MYTSTAGHAASTVQILHTIHERMWAATMRLELHSHYGSSTTAPRGREPEPANRRSTTVDGKVVPESNQTIPTRDYRYVVRQFGPGIEPTFPEADRYREDRAAVHEMWTRYEDARCNVLDLDETIEERLEALVGIIRIERPWRHPPKDAPSQLRALAESIRERAWDLEGIDLTTHLCAVGKGRGNGPSDALLRMTWRMIEEGIGHNVLADAYGTLRGTALSVDTIGRWWRQNPGLMENVGETAPQMS